MHNAIPGCGYAGCTYDNVGLRLSYERGDGNELVISAEQTEPGICLLLPAVQKVREAAARAKARIDKLPLVADLKQGESEFKMPPPSMPISGPKPPKK